MSTEQKWPTFVFANPYTGKQESFQAEEWVKGWKPGGEVYGDPVIRVFQPGQPEGDKKSFMVMRAYHLQAKDGTIACDKLGDPILAFQCVVFQPSPQIMNGVTYELVPVLKSRLTTKPTQEAAASK